MPRNALQRWYLVFGLTDETYSVLTTLPQGTAARRMFGLALLNQGWWVLGSALGAAIGTRAQLTLAGLDFALVALFAVLTVEQWRTRRTLAPLLSALLAYTAATLLAAEHALALAIALCVAAGALWAEKPAAKTSTSGVSDD